MQKTNGMLNHYQALLEGGAWQKGFIVPMMDSTLQNSHLYKVTPLDRTQLSWWINHQRAARVESSIPDLRPMTSLTPVRLFTDAVGGSKSKTGNDGFYMAWSRYAVVLRNVPKPMSSSVSLYTNFYHLLSLFSLFFTRIYLVFAGTCRTTWQTPSESSLAGS